MVLPVAEMQLSAFSLISTKPIKSILIVSFTMSGCVLCMNGAFLDSYCFRLSLSRCGLDSSSFTSDRRTPRMLFLRLRSCHRSWPASLQKMSWPELEIVSQRVSLLQSPLFGVRCLVSRMSDRVVLLTNFIAPYRI